MGEVIQANFGTEREWEQTKGIETTMAHSVQVFMRSIYDLCTSKLKA